MFPADLERVQELIDKAFEEKSVIDLVPPKRPKLVSGGGGGSIFEHPFKVSLSGGFIRVAKGRAHFWKGDEWVITELEITSADSSALAVVADSSGGYAPEYIYVQLKYEDPDWVWSLGHSIENPQNVDDSSNAPITVDDQEQRTWIIAYMDTDGSIDQRINQDIYETMGG